MIILVAVRNPRGACSSASLVNLGCNPCRTMDLAASSGAPAAVLCHRTAGTDRFGRCRLGSMHRGSQAGLRARPRFVCASATDRSGSALSMCPVPHAANRLRGFSVARRGSLCLSELLWAAASVGKRTFASLTVLTRSGPQRHHNLRPRCTSTLVDQCRVEGSCTEQVWSDY